MSNVVRIAPLLVAVSAVILIPAPAIGQSRSAAPNPSAGSSKGIILQNSGSQNTTNSRGIILQNKDAGNNPASKAIILQNDTRQNAKTARKPSKLLPPNPCKTTDKACN